VHIDPATIPESSVIIEMHFSATVPFPREEVFDYVSDPRHWSEFFPAVESVERVEGWDAPGDAVGCCCGCRQVAANGSTTN
jgi:hypothetical protein